MNLIIKDNELSLIYNNKTVFTHTEMHPFISAIKANYKYSTSHGNFQVKETIKKRILLNEYEIESKSNNELVIIFSAQNIAIKVMVNVENNALRFSFDTDSKDLGFEFNFVGDPDEAIFGGGEQYRQLNLKNEIVKNCVSEHIVIWPIIQKTLLSFMPYKEKGHFKIDTYAPMSTFVSSKMYAIRFDVSNYGIQDFKNKNILKFRYDGCPKSALYVLGKNFKEIAKRLNEDIPNNEYIPEWVYNGLILGVQGGIDRAEEMANKLINSGAKVSSVWCQDWSGKKITAAGKQVYWNWEVDSSLYPDLKNRISALKEKGIRFLGYINPYLVKDGPLYNYCKDKGYLIKTQKGEIYHVKSTTFDAGMMDLTNPEMVEYLKETLIKKNMLDLGIDGYMADFGEYLPVDSVLYNGDAKILHNEWPTLWARLNREAVDSHERKEETFFFTRSTYNGSQKYTTMMWNGDQHTDFTKDYGMPCTIPASFNLGFSGMSMVHSDIGGFISFQKLQRDPEIFTRWMEMNTFSMVMRSHETIRPEANSQPYDDAIIENTAKLTNVHVALTPYLKECAKQAHEGIPVMRPDFYEDNDFSLRKELYSYFLGDEIFVCPVIARHATERIVHLPSGNWKQFFVNKEFEGSKEIKVDAPLGMPIAFYRADGKFASLFETIKL